MLPGREVILKPLWNHVIVSRLSENTTSLVAGLLAWYVPVNWGWAAVVVVQTGFVLFPELAAPWLLLPVWRGAGAGTSQGIVGPSPSGVQPLMRPLSSRMYHQTQPLAQRGPSTIVTGTPGYNHALTDALSLGRGRTRWGLGSPTCTRIPTASRSE